LVYLITEELMMKVRKLVGKTESELFIAFLNIDLLKEKISGL